MQPSDSGPVVRNVDASESVERGLRAERIGWGRQIGKIGKIGQIETIISRERERERESTDHSPYTESCRLIQFHVYHVHLVYHVQLRLARGNGDLIPRGQTPL
jgi:hypothetical protein